MTSSRRDIQFDGAVVGHAWAGGVLLANGNPGDVKPVGNGVSELLADLDDQPASATVVFEGSHEFGAANLRGTDFPVRDVEVRSPIAHADEMIGNHPDLDHRILITDALTAVHEFDEAAIA